MADLKNLSDIKLVGALTEAFGPSGFEDEVGEYICSALDGVCDAYTYDKVGNLIVKICGKGYNYNSENPTKVMVSAHMDEVGFMIKKITEEGYLKFELIGDIDSRLLCGRRVTVCGTQGYITGVIATKAIHLQSKEERRKKTDADKLYIDIGASDKEDAEKLVAIGCWATFDSDFYEFGQDNAYIKGKALSSRLGCAALIEAARKIVADRTELPYDLYLVFTKCGEITHSGASTTARVIKPNYCIVLNASPAFDYPEANEVQRVSKLCDGAVIPYMDNDAIYDRPFIDFALSAVELYGGKTQFKTAVTGKGDAGKIYKAGAGVRTMSLQYPVRNLGSAACVACAEDYREVRNLLCNMLENWKMY